MLLKAGNRRSWTQESSCVWLAFVALEDTDPAQVWVASWSALATGRRRGTRGETLGSSSRNGWGHGGHGWQDEEASKAWIWLIWLVNYCLKAEMKCHLLFFADCYASLFYLCSAKWFCPGQNVPCCGHLSCFMLLNCYCCSICSVGCESSLCLS
jgi:hypothetical protein